MIQALESTKSNFVGMQTQLDKSLAEKEKHWTQLPTLQDELIDIQVDLDCLQAERTKFEVECQKMEASRKSLELVVAMDAGELWIATKWGKRLEKENANLNVRLLSQENNLRKLAKTMEHLQLNVKELSYHVLIMQEQLKDQ